MAKSLSICSAILGIFTVFMLSLGTVIAGGNKSIPLAAKTINIGIYAPFTTKSAYIGRNILGAMELARDQLKSSEINYQFYTLDSSSDNVVTINTLQKFVDVHHINVLLTERTATGDIAAVLAAKNDLLHFCLGCNVAAADGKNNFQIKSPNHRHGAVLTGTTKPGFIAQFEQEYLSHPVTEAGYAYDVFSLLNNSAVLAMKTHSGFSSQEVAAHLLALESGSGLMGLFSLGKKGITYQQGTLIA